MEIGVMCLCPNRLVLLLLFMFSFPSTISSSHGDHNSTPATANSTWLNNNLDIYIVHVQHLEGKLVSLEDRKSYYMSFLPRKSGDDLTHEQRLIYSYRNVITGFAAWLTPQEAKSMEAKDGLVSAHRQRMRRVDTTYTRRFLGLAPKKGLWKGSSYGKSMVIGVLDTGVASSHPSFDDAGMPLPPSHWKGSCELEKSLCNNKIIGARVFLNARKDRVSPIDGDDHGTHTASIAAGNFVHNANVYGMANGTAAGLAPLAHLAIYKVCDDNGQCGDSDILAGIEAAIDDGVDVLSISMSGALGAPIYKDVIAIGAFRAVEKGILVSCSAGNSGPSKHTVENDAPWTLTVGASTTDTRIMATASLGNEMKFDGETIFQPGDDVPLTPLVYAGMNDAEKNKRSAFCGEGSLSNMNVTGRVVLCDEGGNVYETDKGREVKDAGGAAMILANQESWGYDTFADPHVLPAAHVSYAAGLKIKAYINSTSTPSAGIIFKGTVVGIKPSPSVVFFSSRGPSQVSPDVLKPDVIGPGQNILGAWPFPIDDNNNNDDSRSAFFLLSGTSMSCPHLSGIVALLKSSHPHWSPAAIKSAIMTSADIVNGEGEPILDESLLRADAFALGAGHVNPEKANDPGLIYDSKTSDYSPYLCTLGYSDDQVGIITGKTTNCSMFSNVTGAQLNYPTFSILLGNTSRTYERTVTNVGPAFSTYTATITAPEGASVSIRPSILEFEKPGQNMVYRVTFSRSSAVAVPIAQGSLEWVSSQAYICSDE